MQKEEKILLLDDDNDLRFNLKLFFDDEGLECDAYEDAETALMKLNENNYDVAIVDLRLPGIDGEEFILRANKINSRMKYIIHTGSAEYIVSNKLEHVGLTGDHVLSKPVENMAEFLAKIQSLRLS